MNMHSGAGRPTPPQPPDDGGLTREDLVWLADFIDAVLAENRELRRKLDTLEDRLGAVRDSQDRLSAAAGGCADRLRELGGELLSMERGDTALRDEIDRFAQDVDEAVSTPANTLDAAKAKHIRDALLSASVPVAPVLAPVPQAPPTPAERTEAEAAGFPSLPDFGEPARPAQARTMARPATAQSAFPSFGPKAADGPPAGPLSGQAQDKAGETLGRDVDQWQRMFDAKPRNVRREPGTVRPRSKPEGSSKLKTVGLVLLLVTVVAVGALLGIKLSLTWLAKF